MAPLTSAVLPQARTASEPDGIQLLLLGRRGCFIDFHEIALFKVIHAGRQWTQSDVVLDLVNLARVDLALGSRVEERLPIASSFAHA
jgi:hypothetical protein